MSGQKWPLRLSRSPAKAQEAADCTMPRLLRQLSPYPVLPAYHCPSSISSLHAFLSLLSSPISFHLASPLFFNSPLSFLS